MWYPEPINWNSIRLQMNKLPSKRQTGVALISVLLVFALATIIAGEVMWRNYRDIRKTANFINGKQAYHFALSGEQFARQLIYRDFAEGEKGSSAADTLADDWAMDFPEFEIEGGEMHIEVKDLQGRFNINHMLQTRAQNQFRQIGNRLSLSEDYTDRIIDWLDENKTALAAGAEDIDYSDGYLPANRLMTDVSELLLIKGMAIEDFLEIKPLLTVLPGKIANEAIDNTKYNINTVDAKILEAVAGLSSEESSQIVDQQLRGGYNSLNSWFSGPSGSKLRSVSTLWDIKTQFFEIIVTVNYQQRIVVLTSQLHRSPEDGSITIIKRQVGTANSVITG